MQLTDLMMAPDLASFATAMVVPLLLFAGHVGLIWGRDFRFEDQAVEIAEKTLSAICHAVGKLQVADTEELHLQPMLVRVAVQANGYNAVKGYTPIDGSKPAPPARPAPVTAAPLEATPTDTSAAPASRSKAPWARSA